MLWFRDLLFITIISGAGRTLWGQCILCVIALLHCAIMSVKWGRQEIPVDPPHHMCFHLKIDDVNEERQPSVDILICH